MKPPHVYALLPVLLSLMGSRQIPEQDQSVCSENHATMDTLVKTGQNVRLLFWNVENLFDYRDDTTSQDEEFTSRGTMHWTYSKLRVKLSRVAKTMLAAGEWEPPGIIGLCEIENRYVLDKLVFESPLKPFLYRVIHRDSPDPRGIDVALLYREAVFTPLHSRWLSVHFPFDPASRTRDILYVKGVLLDTDTVHLFVNHWPSRRGGEKASAPRREFVASVLRTIADSILHADTRFGIRDMRDEDRESRIDYPFIVIMGDFNDEPENESIYRVLQAKHPDSVATPLDLVNLMRPMVHREGSHKFREHWGLLDQFIISGAFLLPGSKLRIDPASASIFRPDFLLEEDQKYLGQKPKRTYLGPRYRGGVSDHLPVVVEIKKLRN